MVSVTKCSGNNHPCLVEGKSLNIKQDSKELDCCNSGMCVVKLDLVQLGEVSPVRVVELESFDDVLNGCATEEVLLLQSKLLAFPGAVIRIEHTCDVLSSLALHDGLVVHAVIELLEIELVAWSGSPKS